MEEGASEVQEAAPATENAAGDTPSEGCDLDLILDIPLEVSVELGKVKMLINDLLQLNQGSIVELTKTISEPLDIYINNKLIAKGEVVVMDEKFAVRVVDIINPVDRVKFLG